MRRVALAMALAIALGATACGSVTSKASHPAKKTDIALCSKVKSELLDVQTQVTGLDTPTASQATALADKISGINDEVGQLLDEATTASDKRRLGAVTTMLGDFVAGLQSYANGDVEGAMGHFREAQAQQGAVSDTSYGDICGGGSNAGDA